MFQVSAHWEEIEEGFPFRWKKTTYHRLLVTLGNYKIPVGLIESSKSKYKWLARIGTICLEQDTCTTLDEAKQALCNSIGIPNPKT